MVKMNEVIDRLVFARETQGVSIRQLCAKSELSYTFVQSLGKRYEHRISYLMIVKLARALDLSLDYVLYGKSQSEKWWDNKNKELELNYKKLNKRDACAIVALTCKWREREK